MAFPATNNQSPLYAITPVNGRADLNAASAGALGANTNAQAVYLSPVGAGNVGTRIYSLIATSTDTAAVNLYIQIQEAGGTVVPLAQVNVPANSGNTALNLATNCLNSAVSVGLPVDNTGKPYIELTPGDSLIVSVVANMTAAKHCYVSFMGANYQ